MKKVVVAGTFDILHLGHLALFKQARRQGDHLTVIVSRDENARQIKGVKPLFTAAERKELLSHLDLIDEVRIGEKQSGLKIIKKIKPDIVLVGYDQDIDLVALQQQLVNWGLKTRVIRARPYQPKIYKSGVIKNKILSHP